MLSLLGSLLLSYWFPLFILFFSSKNCHSIWFVIKINSITSEYIFSASIILPKLLSFALFNNGACKDGALPFLLSSSTRRGSLSLIWATLLVKHSWWECRIISCSLLCVFFSSCLLNCWVGIVLIPKNVWILVGSSLDFSGKYFVLKNSLSWSCLSHSLRGLWICIHNRWFECIVESHINLVISWAICIVRKNICSVFFHLVLFCLTHILKWAGPIYFK